MQRVLILISLNPAIEMNVGFDVSAVTFSANGEYLLTGGWGEVGVWRVEDGEQIATMAGRGVRCLAVSKDSRWIAAGSSEGVFVWNARTYGKVFSHRDSRDGTLGVDFSPDSTRFVSASKNRTATVWDIATRKRVLTLCVRYMRGYLVVISFM